MGPEAGGKVMGLLAQRRAVLLAKVAHVLQVSGESQHSTGSGMPGSLTASLPQQLKQPSNRSHTASMVCTQCPPRMPPVFFQEHEGWRRHTLSQSVGESPAVSGGSGSGPSS